MNCFGCCATCHPRYRRLVDAIYPSAPESGLVKNNMQKLTFYAISHPEKLDRIGGYLTRRVGRDVLRQRIGHVRVAVEAMNQLLVACHGSPSLNLYVESFLTMVHRLLETRLPDMELLATSSFVNFANIEEDTPSYHRRYDFFISKFSSLCHNNAADLAVRQKLRAAGIKGLRGVVRKTASDDLQANIWEKQHMDKIVPSLLFNMHDSVNISFGSCEGTDQSSLSAGDTDDRPSHLADSCLRELIGKASFGNIKNALYPAATHFDLHHLWTPPKFAISVFEAIVYSVQSQYSYVVIQMLNDHLGKHGTDSAEMRCGIATVLSRIVVIAATASIGPSIFEIFNSMLRHLRQSAELQSSDSTSDQEKVYQDILINTMANFADNLPDYQKVEIMVFIIGKLPSNTTDKLSDKFLQHVLMRTLHKVATKYRTSHLSTVLTSTFLEPLLKMSLVDDSSIRLLVLQILQTLVDRHQNLPLLQKLQSVDSFEAFDPSKFCVEKFSRADAMFVHKFSNNLLLTLYDASMMANNETSNYHAIFVTMALLFLELGCESVILDLFRLAMALQHAIMDKESTLTTYQKVHIKAIVAEFVFVAASFLSIPSLTKHSLHLLQECRDNGLSPEDVHYSLDVTADNASGVFLFDSESADLLADDAPDLPNLDATSWLDGEELKESLRLRDYDVTRLGQPFLPSMREAESTKLSNNSTDSRSSSCVSESSASSVSARMRKASKRLDSMLQQDGLVFPATVDGLRQALTRTTDCWTQKEQERWKETIEMFQTMPFAQLVEIQQQRRSRLNATVERLFQDGHFQSTGGKSRICKVEFPELFVY
ncbi:hypothetical protein M514_01639 [Trichuris suis]|uniref:Protein EFR3 homolog n=1 Tax=Trichuris suis TaxID=68888 RepID=A0A085MJZ0_9BILA|nr:hypothetical protein M513_01639 [Trichuris suis]KFD63571.1 hypothetical protein M514_01639 [Trichuris suis]